MKMHNRRSFALLGLSRSGLTVIAAMEQVVTLPPLLLPTQLVGWQKRGVYPGVPSWADPMKQTLWLELLAAPAAKRDVNPLCLHSAGNPGHTVLRDTELCATRPLGWGWAALPHTQPWQGRAPLGSSFHPSLGEFSLQSKENLGLWCSRNALSASRGSCCAAGLTLCVDVCTHTHTHTLRDGLAQTPTASNTQSEPSLNPFTAAGGKS